MTIHANAGSPSLRLRRGVVLHVEEDSCEVLSGGETSVVGCVPVFPAPRTERVSPGHLVALATMSTGTEAVVWRWYDAVLVGEEAGQVRLWKPAHGELLATPRRSDQPRQPGTGAYLSAGLSGSDWWVAGPAVTQAEKAEVEFDEVEDLLRRARHLESARHA